MQHTGTRFPRRALLGAVLAAPALPALAQGEWPTRPIRIIVAQPAGGNLDILVRGVADGLRQEFGQNVVVENRAGGQGVIGLEACANSAPDGTTFCAVNIENMSTVPHVLPELFARYSSLRPVTEIATGQAVLVGSLEVPAGATLREFITWARGRPGLNYGSSGVGSAQQLVWEWLKAREGLQMEHVPFRGISDAFRELVGGRLHASYGGLALAMPFIREGRIRPLAILGSERVAELPGTPSMVELGYDYPYAGPWWGFAAPGGVPDAIVERLAAATRRVVRDEEFHRRMLAPHFFSGVGSTPQEFAAQITRQREASVELLRLSGLLPAR
jgi:tripartite-type tricarboxylate transporter receptor subunit TctC